MNQSVKKMLVVTILFSCAIAFQIQGIQDTHPLRKRQKYNSIDLKTQQKLREQIRKNAKRPQILKKSPLLNEVFGNSQNLIKQKQLNGNMLLIDNYLLFSKNTDEQYPTILKLNLETMQLETINYPQLSEFNIYEALVLADLKNGDIALGGGEYILIIDKSSFKLKQTIKGQFWDSIVLKFNVYVDGSIERIIVQRGSFQQGVKRFYELKKTDGSGLYTQIFLTYSPQASWAISASFQMTSYNEAASLSGYDISYWQNLNSIIDISYNKKYLLGEAQYIATSQSQTLLVLQNKQRIYQFYKIDDNYELILLKSLNISYDQHIKGQFTSDEKQFFVHSYGYYNKSISKANLQTGTITLLSDTDPKRGHIDFHLFAKETDRMIVLASKNKEYFLQLRSISNLTIIHEIPLTFQFQVVSQRIMGNLVWGLNFNLASASSRFIYAYPNALTVQYTIIDDKIVKTDLQDKFYSESLKSCNKYFINLDPYHKDTIEVRHFSNFSVAKTIKSTQSYYITVMNDFMIIGSQSVTLYDFSKSLEEKGIFFKSVDRLYFQLNLLLPKRGVYMDLTTVEYFHDSIKRAIYNISLPQIKTVQKINDTENRIGGQMYFQPFPNSPCNKVYYLQFNGDQSSKTDALLANQQARLVEYDECSKKISKYPIQFTESWHERLMISSDKKYLIIVMEEYVYQSNNFYIEIRARENLGEILLRKQFSLGQLYNSQSIIYFDVDVMNDSQLIAKSNNFVYTTDIKLTDSGNLQIDRSQ